MLLIQPQNVKRDGLCFKQRRYRLKFVLFMIHQNAARVTPLLHNEQDPVWLSRKRGCVLHSPNHRWKKQRYQNRERYRSWDWHSATPNHRQPRDLTLCSKDGLNSLRGTAERYFQILSMTTPPCGTVTVYESWRTPRSLCAHRSRA